MHRREEPYVPEFSDVEAARARIENLVAATRIVHEPRLDDELGCRVRLKCENEQVSGSFKLRGASNAIARLRARGIGEDVATHSSGNHGAALALAARRDGRGAHIVMPRDSVRAKIDAVRQFGGNVILCEPGQQARESGLARLTTQGYLAIPPYDHADIIAGQGTAAVELLEQAEEIDTILVPLGGGGLLAGTTLAARALRPGLRIIGAEPAGAADAHASLERGTRVESWQPDTIADGLRAVIGKLNFEIIRAHVDDVLLAGDEAIISAMKLILECTGMAVEPSSAVAIAVIREHPEQFREREVGVIISGGNVDTERFPWTAGPG